MQLRTISAPEQHPPESRADPAAAALPRRIVFVNRYFFPDQSATSQLLFDLVRNLASRGVEVHVVCSRQLYESPAAELARRETVAGVRVHRVWTSRFGRKRLAGRALDYSSFYLAAGLRLLKLVRSGDVLVAETDPPLISLVAAMIAGLRGALLINWLQDVFPEIASRLGALPLPGLLQRGLRRLRDTSLRMAKANVVLGVRMREYIISREVAPARVRVIENWSDGEAVEPLPPGQSQLRQRLGLNGKFVVQYSGNLGRAHDFETILGAVIELAGDPEIRFLMVGGGVNMARLREAAAQHELAGISFLPLQPRESLADCLAAGDVHLACLLPALEGLIVPSKVYGILAAGRPVIFIGDADGEVASMVRAGQCGVAVAKGEPLALADELRRLKASPEALRIMGRQARQLFMARYTVQRAVSDWVDLLAQAAPSSSRTQVVDMGAA